MGYESTGSEFVNDIKRVAWPDPSAPLGLLANHTSIFVCTEETSQKGKYMGCLYEFIPVVLPVKSLGHHDVIVDGN